MLWWHKPRLVRQPTRLEGDWTWPLCAYMYMSSQVSALSSTDPGVLRQTWGASELSALAFFLPPSQGEFNSTRDSQGTDELLHTARQDPIATSRQKCAAIKISVPQSGSGLQLSYFGPCPKFERLAEEFLCPGTLGQAEYTSIMQRNRWLMAADAVKIYPAIRERFTAEGNTKTTDDGCDWFIPEIEELVTRHTTNWPSKGLLRGTKGLVMGMVLWFSSMAYGGMHIAAWNAYFPTRVEAWMWRSSSIYITASGFIWLTINFLAHQFRFIDAYWDKVLALRAHRSSYLILCSLCSICGVAYVFSRIFLVIEAFISIRQLQIAAYRTPYWTQLIPHF